MYIQDVVLPEKLVEVLNAREIANQEKATYKMQQEAQDQRIQTEKSKGTADMQAALARSKVGIEIKENDATARTAEAKGEAAYIEQTGKAAGAKIEAVGMARARGYKAQVEALGQFPTALVNVASALADKNMKIVPEILVAGGSGSLEGVGAMLMKYLHNASKASAATPLSKEIEGAVTEVKEEISKEEKSPEEIEAEKNALEKEAAEKKECIYRLKREIIEWLRRSKTPAEVTREITIGNYQMVKTKLLSEGHSEELVDKVIQAIKKDLDKA